ncbi:hypothetical protein NGB58_26875, partial [Escherichia coli]|nr:hypothetical protein [Escherichia coli]
SSWWTPCARKIAGTRLNFWRSIPDALRLSAASPGHKEFMPRLFSSDINPIISEKLCAFVGRGIYDPSHP